MSRGKRLQFFCAGDDILSVLDSVESSLRVKYVHSGLFEQANPREFRYGRELPNRGISIYENPGRDSYLVLDVESEVEVRPVPQHDGGMLYAVDQARNPGSVVLTPGGVHATGCVVAGEVGTILESVESLRLFDSFAKAFRHAFRRVRSSWLGPQAAAMWTEGRRLTFNVRASRALDLKAP